MKPSDVPGHNHYTVRVLEMVMANIKVMCPVCYRSFEIKKYGIVKCPRCKSKLEYKERK